MTSDAEERSGSGLRPSDALFGALFEQSPLSIQVLATSGETIAVNTAWERLWGVTLGDLPGYNILEDPQLEANGVRPYIRRAFAGERVAIPPVSFVPDRGTHLGQARWVRAAASPIRDDQGAITQVVLVHEDVTDLVAAEEGLTRLATIVASSDDAIVARTLGGQITAWNRGAERLYGYTSEEAIGLPVTALIPPDRSHELTDIAERLGRGERLERLETVRLRKDGTRVDVSISFAPMRDAAGQVTGISTIARDVTARKRAADAERFLAEAGALLGASLDDEATLAHLAALAVPRLADWCVVHLVDDAGTLRPLAMAHADPTKAPLAAALQQRYPPAPDAPAGPVHVLRTGRSELVPAVTDAQMAAYAQDAEHLRLLRETGGRSYVTVPMLARGRILGTITLVGAEPRRRYGADDLALAEALAGRAAAAIDNARLYAEAQAAEARYRGLFAGVADAILVADAAGRYRDANPAASALLGYSQAELLTLRVADIVAPEATGSDAEDIHLGDEHQWRGDLEVRRKDGTTVPVEASATAVALPTGAVYLSVMRDISERRALERLQQDFIAMVSHDLRSPLTTLKGQAQLLKRHRTFSEPRVDAILAQTERMDRLVGDLADVVRLEAGHLELRPMRMDLGALAHDYVDQTRLRVPGMAISVDAPAAAVVGAWDPSRVGQVVQNLIDNALKYGGSGGVRVRIDADRDEARLAVSDDGPGIVPERLPRLFDRFYRADVTGAGGGLGLGLYIARMLVEAHGGRIWAESAPGEGSTFTVVLPLVPPTAALPGAGERAAAGAAALGSPPAVA